MSDTIESFRALCRDRQVTLTTVAAGDRKYCDRLQTSLVRGSHELLYWGVGPTLYRGDIVGLYTPHSDYLPPSEHGRIRRLYVAAADSTRGSAWNQHVFLHRRLNLDRDLTFKNLTERVGLTFRHIAGAGKLTKPMSEAVAVRFLREVAKRCNDGLAGIEKLTRGAKETPKICVSYSGREWTQAHRVKLWLESLEFTPFFVSPVSDVLRHEKKPLEKFLEQTFRDAWIAVCLLPSHTELSRWMRLEVNAAGVHAKRVILVHRGPAPSDMPKGANVVHFKLRPTGEGELLALVKRELSVLKRG